MGIFNRLENVIRSYFVDDDDWSFRGDNQDSGAWRSSDPDLDTAFEELNDYLHRDGRDAGAFFGKKTGPEDSGAFGQSGRTGDVPGSLRPDFAELGVPFGASAEECKAAYKRLLKVHHPDRHAGHAGNFKKATEKSARINAAYDRIEKWRQDGKI